MCVAIGREESRAFQTSSTGRFSLATSSKIPVREQTISGMEVVQLRLEVVELRLEGFLVLLAKNDPVG